MLILISCIIEWNIRIENLQSVSLSPPQANILIFLIKHAKPAESVERGDIGEGKKILGQHVDLICMQEERSTHANPIIAKHMEPELICIEHF